MIINISSGKTTAAIDTLGAEIKSFKREDGFEVLWQGNPEFWAGQAPVLFPVVGAVREGKVKIEGEYVEMNRHGFARKCEFQVIEQGEDFVAMSLKADDNTKKLYPYDFQFIVTYTVSKNAVETKFTVANLGDKKMPYVVGGHPAYNIPLCEGEVFEDYDIVFSDKENLSCPEIDLKECLIDFSKTTLKLENENIIPLRHNLFYRDALVFDKYKSKTVGLISKKSGKGIEMDISQFIMLGIWSCVNDGPYVALEPWLGCATTTDEGDDLEEKRYMRFLEKDQKETVAFTTRCI